MTVTSALKELTQRPSIEEIDKRVREIFGENPRLSRKASLYLCHRYSGRKLREIGVYFGIGESAVSQTSGRLCLQLDKDGKLRKRIKQMENKLKL